MAPDATEPRAGRPGPILIGGTGRCGTTILVRCLARHPGIFTVRWESQFLVAPGGLIEVAAGGFRPVALEVFLERLRGRWFRRLIRPGEPDGYEAGLVHDLSKDELEGAIEFLLAALPAAGSPWPIVREFTDRLFAPPMRRAAARRWCEKTPRSVLFADRLAEIFPDLRFLHVVRDGRDVVASLIARGFWPIAAGHEFPSLDGFRGEVTFERAAGYWVEVLRLARRTAAALPDANYLEVRFEDLIGAPRRVLGEICDFVGEEVDDSMLEEDLSLHHIGRWRDELTPEQVNRFEHVAGSALRAEGYR